MIIAYRLVKGHPVVCASGTLAMSGAIRRDARLHGWSIIVTSGK